MASAPLTSDHVNYLIWRYLQESGHGEAAVKLQRDWLLDPQSLPFAQNIKTHALVVLIQKGLQYHEVEQSLKQPAIQNQSSPAALFFGSESGRTSSSVNPEQSEDGLTQTSPRAPKHRRESTTNGLCLDFSTPAPAAKRGRRSNGIRGASDSVHIDQNGYHYHEHEPREPISPTTYSPAEDAPANGMEVDDEADALASPNPEDDEMTLTLTNGPSIGVQSDKIAQLVSNTTILTLPEKYHVINHTSWNPKEPTILAAAGIALCRIWRISKTSFADDYFDISQPPDDFMVTAMAWSPDGETLAVATRSITSEWTGAVSLWMKNGRSRDELPAAQDMILKLRWNHSGTQLLGLSNFGAGGSSLTLWDTSSSESQRPNQFDCILTNAAWMTDYQFIVCGHGMIVTATRYNQEDLHLETRFGSFIESHKWTHIRHDHVTSTTAVAAEDTAALAIIDREGIVHTTIAHDDVITALAYQPTANPASYATSTARLLATSSLDGSVKIWDTTQGISLVHTLSIGNSSTAMAISFTPDGYLVAAANWNRVLIWSAEAGGLPKASWNGELGQLSKSSLTNGSTNGTDKDSGIEMDEDRAEDEEPNCSLSWDAEGRKLALGVGCQIAIINFQP